MGGLLRKKRPEPFTPDLRKLWNTQHALSFDFKRQRFQLMMDWEMFGLKDRDYGERSHLRVDREGRRFMVDLTCDSTIPEYKLADFRELTDVHYRFANYTHERDWPAQDEPAVQVLVHMVFGTRFLRFEQSNYCKFSGSGENSDSFADWLQSLCQTAEAGFHPTRCQERLGWNAKWP